jgi:dolichyl-phosphate beta-glucosyltransferase
MSGQTLIVVPCYNEAQRLDLAAFDAFLERSSNVNLLLVDDGSTDDTLQVLERLRALHPAKVDVLALEANVGKAEAVRRGVRAALRQSPALVGYWDADLATPLEAILQFRNVLDRQPELMLVMGSRVALLGRQIERSWKRHLAGRTFATAASLVLGLPVYDTQCGAKLFRVSHQTAGLFDRPFRARWVFDVELLGRLIASARAAGEPSASNTIYEYPLEHWQDVAGSRLRGRDFLVAAVDLATIYWRHRSAKKARSKAPRSIVPQPVRQSAA